jgi:hypothetical protein
MKRTLPPLVSIKHGSYWHVATVESKRKWTKLCRVKEGLPAMYLALAALKADKKGLEDMMPTLVANWMLEVGIKHKAKTQADDRTHNKAITNSFRDFRAGQIEPPDVTKFLTQWDKQPRSYNAYRAAPRRAARAHALRRGQGLSKGWQQPGRFHPDHDREGPHTLHHRQRAAPDQSGRELRRRWQAHARRAYPVCLHRHGLPTSSASRTGFDPDEASMTRWTHWQWRSVKPR